MYKHELPYQPSTSSDSSPDGAPSQDLASIIKDLSKEPLLGNINMYCASPPGRAPVGSEWKAGHLVFDAMFESGNLASVAAINECEYDLYIRPDTCNPKQRLWFYYSVGNVMKDQKVIFNVINFSKIKSLYSEGMAPVVRSTSRPKWQRIPPRHVHYYRSLDHDRNFVMSFAFAFDRPDDTYYFAYCYPYTYTKLQQFLTECENAKKTCFSRELLSLTVVSLR